jgi:hypothetical protein
VLLRVFAGLGKFSPRNGERPDDTLGALVT